MIIYLIGKTLWSIIIILYQAIKSWFLRAEKATQKKLLSLGKSIMDNINKVEGVSNDIDETSESLCSDESSSDDSDTSNEDQVEK